MGKIGSFVHFFNKNDGNLTTKALRGGFWVAISSIGINGLAFIRSIILARLLLPEIFGLMGICLIVIRGLEVFTQTGFGAALIQRKGEFEEARDTAFTLLIIRGFLLGGILFLLSPFVARFYQKEVLDFAIKVIAISFIFSGFRNINVIAYQKEMNFKRLTYLDQIGNVVNFCVVISLAYFLRNVWALVIAYVVSSAMSVLFSFIIISPTIKLRFDRVVAKELFNYGKFITGLSIVLFAATELDNAIIGKVLGIEALGYYILAYTIANLVTTHIAKIVSAVLLPAYSKLQNKPVELRKFYLKVTKLISIIVLPSAAGIISLAPEIIRVVYGGKWLPAVIPLQIMAIFGVLRAFAAINGYIFNGIGKPGYDFWTGIVRLILLSILIIPITLRYGIIGTAVTITIAIAAQLVAGIYLLKRVIVFELNELATIIAKPLICSILMGIIVSVMKRGMFEIEIAKLVLLIGVGVGSYLFLNRGDVIAITKNVNNIMVK